MLPTDTYVGYRITRDRAQAPSAPESVLVVSTQEVVALMAEGALILDLQPVRKFPFAEDGRWICPEPHASLAGAVWPPVVGWGVTKPWAGGYSCNALAQDATQAAPVVVFCQLDCWLSWNAAQPVRDLGSDAGWHPGCADD